jgi:hypothetical protein
MNAINSTLCGAETSRGYNATTSSGKPFWPLAPELNDIRITDIAEHLSRICRYGGALRSDVQFYSVAQHSVLCSLHVPPDHAVEALLHDAAEAYVGDMVRPLKLMMPEYRAVEDQIDRLIRQKFNLPAEMSTLVKQADRSACATERRDLLAESPGLDWGPMPRTWSDRIEPLLPFEARDLFIARARQLGFAI